MSKNEINAKVRILEENLKSLNTRVRKINAIQNKFIDYCDKYSIQFDPESLPLSSDRAWTETTMSESAAELRKLKKAAKLLAQAEELIA